MSIGSSPLPVGPDAGQATRVPIAYFTYRVGVERWEWSDDVYQLHGFSRGEVVPTTKLLLSHIHPDDRESVTVLLRAVLIAGEPLVCRYRIIDAVQHERTVVVFANASRDAQGRVSAIEGVMADVTRQVRGEIQEATTAAVNGVTASRGAIDEAKGVLMGRYGLNADEAFNVLKILSSHTNCKLRTLAQQLVVLLTQSRTPVDEATVVDDLSSALRED